MVTHIFRWRTTRYGPLSAQLSGRFGDRCRVWARSLPLFGMVGIEFEDGYRAIVHRYAVRLESRAID